MFAYAPLDGYCDDRDAVEFPWERWEQEVGAQGRGLADWFADMPAPRDPPGIERLEATRPEIGRPPGRAGAGRPK